MTGKKADSIIRHPGRALASAGIHRAAARADVTYYVYMLASKPFGTLYVGMTSDLIGRVYQHRIGALEGFTRKYNVKTLVWFEMHDTALAAIAREKSIKRWSRAAKVRVIEERNPHWRDLYHDLAR
jgi:putative endonuclease